MGNKESKSSSSVVVGCVLVGIGRERDLRRRRPGDQQVLAGRQLLVSCNAAKNRSRKGGETIVL